MKGEENTKGVCEQSINIIVQKGRGCMDLQIYFSRCET